MTAGALGTLSPGGVLIPFAWVIVIVSNPGRIVDDAIVVACIGTGAGEAECAVVCTLELSLSRVVFLSFLVRPNVKSAEVIFGVQCTDCSNSFLSTPNVEILQFEVCSASGKDRILLLNGLSVVSRRNDD